MTSTLGQVLPTRFAIKYDPPTFAMEYRLEGDLQLLEVDLAAIYQSGKAEGGADGVLQGLCKDHANLLNPSIVSMAQLKRLIERLSAEAALSSHKPVVAAPTSAVSAPEPTKAASKASGEGQNDGAALTEPSDDEPVEEEDQYDFEPKANDPPAEQPLQQPEEDAASSGSGGSGDLSGPSHQQRSAAQLASFTWPAPRGARAGASSGGGFFDDADDSPGGQAAAAAANLPRRSSDGGAGTLLSRNDEPGSGQQEDEQQHEKRAQEASVDAEEEPEDEAADPEFIEEEVDDWDIEDEEEDRDLADEDAGAAGLNDAFGTTVAATTGIGGTRISAAGTGVVPSRDSGPVSASPAVVGASRSGGGSAAPAAAAPEALPPPRGGWSTLGSLPPLGGMSSGRSAAAEGGLPLAAATETLSPRQHQGQEEEEAAVALPAGGSEGGGGGNGGARAAAFGFDDDDDDLGQSEGLSEDISIEEEDLEAEEIAGTAPAAADDDAWF